MCVCVYVCVCVCMCVCVFVCVCVLTPHSDTINATTNPSHESVSMKNVSMTKPETLKRKVKVTIPKNSHKLELRIKTGLDPVEQATYPDAYSQILQAK